MNHHYPLRGQPPPMFCRTLTRRRKQRFVIVCIIMLAFLYKGPMNVPEEIEHFHVEDAQPPITLSNKTAALCTVIKDPQKRYIDEWADYHMMAAGFTSLRLYDNTQNFTLKNWGEDKSYSSNIRRIHFLPDITHNITYFEGVKSNVQSAAFMDCVKSAIEEGIDWVATFDMDEFLVLYNTTSSIVDFMEEYCEHPCGQLSFNWLLFGSSNRSKYAPVPETKRFQYRIQSNDDNLVKGIADPKAVDQSSL